MGEHNSETAITWTAEQVEGVQEAIEEVHYRFSCYSRTTDILNRAHHLTELANAVSDLMTWHPSYDLNSGTLGWQREDWDEAPDSGSPCHNCLGHGPESCPVCNGDSQEDA